MTNKVISNTINIDWFGDRKLYEKSDIRIITVGLNPSDREFSDATHPLPDVSLRFGNIPTNMLPTYPSSGNFQDAWNNYFKNNPYKWFGHGFEPVLRGLCASYGGKLLQNGENVSNIAIHTDLCTPWSTDPTWSELSILDKNALTNNYLFLEWKDLVDDLKPDIIIACIPQDYRIKLMGHNNSKDIIKIVHTKTGECRNRPVIIRADVYNGALIVFGQTRNVPFGNVTAQCKKLIGQLIGNCYQHLKTYNNLSSFSEVVI